MANEFRLTDSANAEKLIELFGADIRYCPSKKEWYVWDGRRWLEDTSKRIYSLAKQTARSYEETAEALSKDSDFCKALTKHSRASENLRGLQAMIQLAQSHDEVIVDHEAFNRNPDILNVANGMIDLCTGKFRKFDRDEHITKIAPVVYVKGRKSNAWDGFMKDVVPDPDIRDFVQRAVGYSLTGHMFEEVMFLLFGDGQNGKTTFMSTLLNMLGGYASQAASSALMKSATRGPNNELYVLVGKRMVLASETGESGKLDETLVKQMTGMDRISVNPKYKSQMEFDPSWKIWLGTNHEPTITGDDTAIWRRMVKIPFTATIAKPDPKLKLLLLNDFNERSGILNWALEGVRMWQDRRLILPDQIVKATDEYRESQSIIGQFIREVCVVRKGTLVPKIKLYESYVSYCKRIHEKPKTKNAFGRQMHQRGFEDTKTQSVRYLSGIHINVSLSLNPADWA